MSGRAFVFNLDLRASRSRSLFILCPRIFGSYVFRRIVFRVATNPVSDHCLPDSTSLQVSPKYCSASSLTRDIASYKDSRSTFWLH